VHLLIPLVFLWSLDPILVKTLDPQGKLVPAVQVEATNNQTHQTFTCSSDATGSCRLTLPNPGAYTITATTPGLTSRSAHQLADNSPTVLTLNLEPSTLRSSITVVSGSRLEELQEESPTKVEVVTRAQMLSTGYERVSDVLQEMPGVLVRRGNTSTVGGEQVQGIDSRQVLVLQDGLPVLGARGVKSGAINLSRQSSGRLSRVEVAKGSGSSNYGTDAVGGVINMITREASAPIQGGVVFSGGSLGAFDGRADLGSRRGKGTFFLDLGQNLLDSYRLIPTSPTTVGPNVRRQDILFKSRYQLLPNFSLGATVNAYRNREQGTNLSETGIVNGLSNDSNQSYALIADWIINPSTTLQSRAYAARYDENSTTSPRAGGPIALANLNERLNRLDTTLSRQIGSHHFFQAGGEWAQTLYRGANRLVGDNVGQQVTATDLWVQDKWTLNRRLTFTTGGRLTSHSMFGRAAVPKAGLVFKLSDAWILRGSFGMGFRVPDLGQLYFRFANPATFYQVIGNPNLNPEHSQSFQAGALYRHSRFRLGVGLFRNNVRDLIESRLVGTPRTPADINTLLTTYGIPSSFNLLLSRQTFFYFNQSRIFTQGVELDGEFNFSRRLRASGAYTYLNALDRITTLALPQRHRHQGQMRLDYAIPKYGITTNLRGSFYSHWLLNSVAGTRGLPFQIWDAYIAKSWRQGFQSFLAVDNLNNSRDRKLQLPTPTFDRPDIGRTWRLGLRYRFGSAE